MKTENLAIVFIDIAGFTPRTSVQTREENLRMLQRFDDIVRPIVRAYGGRVVKTIGDAYLLTFRSPTNALLCSMAIHDRIVETDRDVPETDRFTIRAAVNVGEVRVEGGDVFGEAVNIASRIEGKAAAGEIYFSESVYLSMTKSEVPSEEVGYTELKGISGKVRLYRVPRADEAGGYSLARRETQSNSGSEASGSIAPVVLPFGGHGLDRVRDQLNRTTAAYVIAPAVEHAKDLLEKTPTWLERFFVKAIQAFEWWRTEVRRNKTVQYATVAVIAAIIILIIWSSHRKPSTPWQRFKRDFGF